MLTQKQSSKDINGIKTEVVMQPFADRILVLITQLGKVGNLIQVSIPQTTPLLEQPPPGEEESNACALPPPPPSIQLTPLLGSAPTDHLRTLHALYASQVATIIWIAETDERRRGVIVGLALKNTVEEEDRGLSVAERDTFHQVMAMVGDLVKD